MGEVASCGWIDRICLIDDSVHEWIHEGIALHFVYQLSRFENQAKTNKLFLIFRRWLSRLLLLWDNFRTHQRCSSILTQAAAAAAAAAAVKE
jgi:hypothetical protein